MLFRKELIKRSTNKRRTLIITLMLMLIIGNFGLSFAYWAASIADDQSGTDTGLNIGFWEYEDTAFVVATYRSTYNDVLTLTTETVDITDKTLIEEALSTYGLLSEAAKAELTSEHALLLDLLAEIIAFEHSVFLDFEAQVYDSLYTGTIDIDGRTWYANNLAISNSSSYDVWIDTRSLALKSGSYFQSQDLFMSGIDTIELYHGALNYNNGTSFAFKVEYELASNTGTWLTIQDGGSDLIIDVISGTPMTYVEIDIQIYEAVNIRFTPVIGNTTDYINLDNIRIYEHIVSSSLEVETFLSVYAGVLSLSTETVELTDLAAVNSALAAYALLTPEAQALLTTEKALLDSLFAEIEILEDIAVATQSVVYAETTIEQLDLNAALLLVDALTDGPEKTALLARLDAVQLMIDHITSFETTYADVLALTTQTVVLADKPDVEAALAAYQLLTSQEKAKLSAEKALLDSLLAELNSQIPTETLVLEFRTNHAVALAITDETLELTDRQIIEEALDAYGLLTPAAQAELTLEKDLLDQLLYEIIVWEAANLVVAAEASLNQSDVNLAYAAVNALPIGPEKTLLLSRLNTVQSNIDSILTYRADHAAVLALTIETVDVIDKTNIENALSAYGLLTEVAQTELLPEKALLLELYTAIVQFEQSEFLDFEGYAYDNGLTGTVVMNDRTWYGSGVYISNDPSYDVWNDTRSLALRTGAYFESRDLFLSGVDKITIYHGALNYNNGASFGFKIEYELASNTGTWLTVQDGGSDLVIDVISGTPLSYSEIPINITEAVNIRFTPVISNTSDYINLDDIRIYEHVVPENLEVILYQTIYSGALAYTTETITLAQMEMIELALAAYDLLSLEAQTILSSEKALLDALMVELTYQQDILFATEAVLLAENSLLQADVDAAQLLVSALPNGQDKTDLQTRINNVQTIIDDIAFYLLTYQGVLALTIETVELTDKTNIENALAAYLALSSEAQGELNAEKALLDSLLIQINTQTPTATLVAEFRTNHATALALTLGTVEITDEFIVLQALSAYDLLTLEAQTELAAEKALLDSLILEIRILEATEAVVLAENSLLQADHDSAQLLVTALSDGSEKTALQNRLDTVQNTINQQAAAYVDGLITSLPSVGEVTLTDESAIINARYAYLALTSTQELLVTQEPLLFAIETQLSALNAATQAVITAEGSLTQADKDTAQALVDVLVDGTPKTDLQNRLNIVQAHIDVNQAVSIINTYFASNSVVVSTLNNNTVKQTAFLAKANEIVSSLGVTIVVNSSTRVSRTNSTYNITVSKNGISTTFTVSVTFTR